MGPSGNPLFVTAAADCRDYPKQWTRMHREYKRWMSNTNFVRASMKLCVVLRKWGWGLLMVMIALLVIFPSHYVPTWDTLLEVFDRSITAMTDLTPPPTPKLGRQCGCVWQMPSKRPVMLCRLHRLQLFVIHTPRFSSKTSPYPF
jgi:hypothetical protein